MKRLILGVICFSAVFFSCPGQAQAISNPLDATNNKIGIHILFPTEIDKAASLVNSNGGDWGYVTIPIQAGDKDMEKWQKFMDDCKRLHVIPIIRLATEGDYFNTQVWRKPNYLDVLDFSNFLSSLNWPTKNKYILVFNEVNRGNEWGGSPDPKEYAEILDYAVLAFKSKSQDFFIISAGLDNAAPNQPGIYMNQYDFIKAMNNSVHNIFLEIDGYSSHSYPNPAFAQPPSSQTPMSISSFLIEKNLIQSLGGRDLPVFITETGWSAKAVPEQTIASYYKEALSNAWSDHSIVAITPFLLQGSGQFGEFSFLKDNGDKTPQYQAVYDLKKEKGTPQLPVKVLGAQTSSKKILEYKTFQYAHMMLVPTFSPEVRLFFRWLLQV